MAVQQVCGLDHSVILECPTEEACINDVLQYNCTINGDLKSWIVKEFQWQSSKEFQLDKFGNALSSSDPDYTVTFTGYTDPYLSSSLSLVATVQSDKTTITCRNDVNSMEKQCMVNTIGKPHINMTQLYWLDQFSTTIAFLRSSRRCCQCNHSSNCSGQCYCHMVPS